ncbi:MAG: hypothetical protein PHW02_06145 [bacterium]|nr:hypothetical protein [bacterium]
MRIIGSERMLDIKNIMKEENSFAEKLSLKRALLFSSGRSSIYYLFSKLRQGEILFPDLFCNEMLNPVLKTDTSIAFYTIKDTLKADVETVSISKKTKYIYINDYCGARDEKLFEFAKKKNLIPVIDRTHSLLSDFPFGREIQLGSFRKILPVPDGGFLLNFEKRERARARDSSFYLMKLDAKILREIYEKHHNDPWYESEYVLLSEKAEKKIKINSKRISLYSEKIIYSYDIKKAAERRRENSEILLSFKEIKKRCPFKNPKLGVVLQSLPLIVDKRDTVKKLLAEKSVYAPVLWRGESSLSMRIINIPLDEEYNAEDMVRTGKSVTEALKGDSL